MTSSQAQCNLLGTDTQLRCDIPNIRLNLTTFEQANHYTDLSFLWYGMNDFWDMM
jgi:hypothetical protein